MLQLCVFFGQCTRMAVQVSNLGDEVSKLLLAGLDDSDLGLQLVSKILVNQLGLFTEALERLLAVLEGKSQL